MTRNYGNCGIGDGILRPDDVNERITNLENEYKIKDLWEDITNTTSGTITVYQRQPPNEAEIIPIYLDKWFNGEDALVVPIKDTGEGKRPNEKEGVFDANGKYIIADIDADGNYILFVGYDAFNDPIPPTLPISGDYCLIWAVKGQAKDMFVIPEEKIVANYDGDPFLVRKGIEGVVVNDGDYLNAENLKQLSYSGSGVYYGCKVSINAVDDTKADISAGFYKVVNSYSDPTKPTFTIVEFEGAIGVSITNLATQPVTFLGLDKDKNVIQQVSPISSPNERDIVPIGGVSHINNLNLDTPASFGNVFRDKGLDMADLFTCIGARINCTGNDFSANGSNLKIDKSAGGIVGPGINSDISEKIINIKTLPQVFQTSFLITKRTVGFSEFISATDVPVDKYQPSDSNGDPLPLTDVPDGYFTTHRIIIAPAFGTNGIIFIQYGQFVYDTMKKAADSYKAEKYLPAPEISAAHTRCVLIVKQGATDLSDLTQAKFANLGTLGSKNFDKIENSSLFSSAINVIRTLSNDRQTITYYDSGGKLYADIAKVFYFERTDISFVNADSSINTVSGDFNNGSMYVGCKIIITESINNNGIFTVASITSTKIVVNETIIDESAGNKIIIDTAGKGNITYNYGELEYELNCTTGDGIGGRARIELTFGTDNSPQENWGYVKKESDNTLSFNNALVEQRGYAFTNVFSAFVPSVASSIADGFYNSRRWTEAKDINGKGVISTLLSKQRDTSDWKSGLLLNITIDTVPTPDDVDVSMDAGVITEIYDQDVNSLQLSIDGALVVNWFGDAYHKIANINEITSDSNGDSLNNKYFSIGFAISLNADGYPDRLIIKVPNGSYTNPKNAYDDTKGYLDMSMPSGFKSIYYLGVGVFRLVGGNSWTNIAISEGGVNYIDKRGDDLKSSASGSGTSAVQEFSDGIVAFFNALDSTKRGVFDLSNITTGNQRTLIWADRDYYFADPTIDSLTINGNTVDGFVLGLANNNKIATQGYVDDTAGNPFDQSLNTTDSVSFAQLTVDYVNINGDQITISGQGNPEFSVKPPAQSNPSFQIYTISQDNINISFDAYYSGGWKSNYALSNFLIQKTSDDFLIKYDSAITVGNAITWNTAFRINTDGNITHPNQCYFDAFNSADDNDVTGDGTAYTVIFNSEGKDVGSNYDNTTGVFASPVDGVYSFSFNIQSQGYTSAHTRFVLKLVLSNGNYILKDLTPVNIFRSGEFLTLDGAKDIYMDKDDTCEVQIIVYNHTKSIDVEGSSEHTTFSGLLNH